MTFAGEYLAREVAPDGREVAFAFETVNPIYGCRTLAHVRARMAPGVPYMVARYRNGGGVDIIAPDGSILADLAHLRPNASGGGWHTVYPVHYAEVDA